MGLRNWRWDFRWLCSANPACEPTPGRRRIDPCDARQGSPQLGQVPARIQEDVRQRVAHLARCAQDVAVVAICEDRAASAENPIHGSRKARPDGFHPSCERLVARRLDDQVYVIGLDRVVGQVKPPALTRRSEAAFQLSDQGYRAQRG